MSRIEWTGKTWNPVHGCTRISPGCRNCYAERMAKRLAGMGHSCYPKDDPFKPHVGSPYNPPTKGMVFVCSMGDLFHEDIPSGTIRSIFGRMSYTPNATFQVLTKRPERMANLCTTPLQNVWLGVSAENQEWYDRRVVTLLAWIKGWTVRFVSLEPLLGPVEIKPARAVSATCSSESIYPDWLIVGGESGPGARECRMEWIESIIEQGRALGIPVFVKQLGNVLAKRLGLKGKGNKPEEWPAHIRVREWPGESK